jgi:hypothetical protein
VSSSRGLPRVHLAGKMGVVFRSLFPFGDLLSGKERQSHRHLWKRRRPADIGTPAAPFAGFLESLIARMGQPVVKPMLRSEPLAHLDYQIESKVKDDGLRLFWQRHRLPGQPEAVIASPRPRGYRTTSKRRAVLHGDTFYLMLSQAAHCRARPSCEPLRAGATASAASEQRPQANAAGAGGEAKKWLYISYILRRAV